MMFYKYVITKLNGKEVLYLYLNQDYEVSSDLYLKKESKRNLIRSAENFLNNLGVAYKGKEIYLVVDNILVGKLQLSNFFKKKNYLEYNRFGKRGRVDFLNVEEHPSLKFIDLAYSSGIIEKMKLNEYLFGVVAREMPFINNEECLKAQAVLARTHLYRMLNTRGCVLEKSKYQLFFNKHYLQKLWKENYIEYSSKIMNALTETDKEVLTFQGNLIHCYTHYQNNGSTEASQNILKISYPYLSSVKSMDYLEGEFLRYRKVDNRYLSKLLGVEVNADTPVKILESTSGNNVRYIQFGNKVFDGLLISRNLGLISNNFTVQVHDDYTTFLTKGCGYGLGLSKCGAKVMAEAGYNYKEILNHYYPNTVLEKITESTLW